FDMYEWCITDAWDGSNPKDKHKRNAHGIEVGDGMP
ncbi:hypothetical protein A4X13_0g9458, partial [Tilletia indica]